MQKTVFICDECEKEIGPVPHLSLQFNGNGQVSGVAIPPKNEHEHWKVSGFTRNFVHLHPKCSVEFFKKAFVRSMTPKKKK